jgi:molecular chaperone DnaK
MCSSGLGLDFGATNFVVSFMENGRLCVSNNNPPGRRKLSSAHLTIDDLRRSFPTTPNCSSLIEQQCKTESLVVAIPEAWYQDVNHPERKRLECLLVDGNSELKPGHWSAVSQAIAAAAYWLTKIQQPEYQGNLLICDMGRCTFDVHLCCISKNGKIKVLYSDHSEAAGLVFDSQCTQLAYMQKHGGSLSKDDPEWGRLLEYFEVEKIKSHARSSHRLPAYLNAPEAMAEYNLYCFGGGYTVKCRQIREAFAPVEQGIQEIMQKLQTWMRVHQQTFDRIVLIGGLCQFPLVQRTIQQALRLQDDDPRCKDCLDEFEKLLAIAYGACLIANNKIDPLEKLPYTVGIVSERLTADLERQQQYTPLILSGTNIESLNIPKFTNFFQLSSFQEDLPSIKIWISSQQPERILKEMKVDSIQLNNYSPDNTWQVGISMSNQGILYLIIRDDRLKQHTEYKLGKLSEILPV